MIEKVKKICEEKGVEITLSDQINKEKMELFWYGENIITLKFKNKTCIISAIGDVRFNIRAENDTYLCVYSNDNNSGVNFGDELLDVIKNDEEFYDYLDAELVEWINNNWLEYFIYENDKLILHEVDEDAASLKDAFYDIEYYIKKIKD